MASAPVEKYQLKWHSHVANLNSSVVNLFRNEKFADVLLMTSHPNETCGIIPAHKVILSSCSHYFSTIFEASPGQTANSLIYVILPPELTKRALEILVQYIYCGEATVHNDVLNEVLKGGEILKIRGLWRGSSSDYIDNHYHQRSFPQPPTHPSTSSGREARIQIAYERERPVVIRNPEERSPARDPAISNSSAANINSRSSVYYPSSSVYVKKDMGRDPGNSGDCETCRITLQSSDANKDAHPSTQMPIEATAAAAAPHQPLMDQQRFISSPESTFRASLQSQPKIIKTFYPSKTIVSDPVDPSTSIDRPFRQHPERERERGIIHHTPNHSSGAFANPLRPPQLTSETPNENIIGPIKQEPPDWADEYEQKPQVEVPVKREVIYNEERQAGSGGDEVVSCGAPMYTPLSCELCKETFTQPGEWVRHIENHAELPQTVPKKRRRTEEINDNIASLRCDLCSMYFLMPADWVRHIQKTHTETELAVSNTLAKSSSFTNSEPLLADQNCVVCTKTNYPTPPDQKGSQS